MNLKKARAMKKNSPADCFFSEWCAVGYCELELTVDEQARRAAAVSCYPDHVEAKFALLRLFYAKKSSARFLASPFSQKVTLGLSVRL
ncbi:MAG: hypothetical protein E7402_04840 [Ruminococcaceae bacterium]|nr:hypothetical protein [Oscillospiraceae bacterium]